MTERSTPIILRLGFGVKNKVLIDSQSIPRFNSQREVAP